MCYDYFGVLLEHEGEGGDGGKPFQPVYEVYEDGGGLKLSQPIYGDENDDGRQLLQPVRGDGGRLSHLVYVDRVKNVGELLSPVNEDSIMNLSYPVSRTG